MAVEAYFNAETIWVSEIDKYACKVIDARINKPNIGNLKIIKWAEVEPVDIITAGYPCQPFSHAGLRKGVLDERHLWPYIKQAISTIRPRIVVLENVRGHFKLGFREVLTDLTFIGYDVRWSIVRASDVGAPHRRERLFIVAEPANTDSERCPLGNDRCTTTRSQGQSQFKFTQLGKVDSDSDNQQLSSNGQMSQLGWRFNSRFEMSMRAVPNPLVNGKLNTRFVEYMMGLPVGWVTDVDISRSQQFKILGNGVVPQQAYRALELLCNINSFPQGLKTCGQHAHSPLKLSTI